MRQHLLHPWCAPALGQGLAKSLAIPGRGKVWALAGALWNMQALGAPVDPISETSTFRFSFLHAQNAPLTGTSPLCSILISQATGEGHKAEN